MKRTIDIWMLTTSQVRLIKRALEDIPLKDQPFSGLDVRELIETLDEILAVPGDKSATIEVMSW